jgi:hypothetical protein
MLLWTAIIGKALSELALMFLVARFLLGLLAGQKRDSNIFYQLLEVTVKPVLWMMRKISPKFIVDQHLPLAAGSTLVMLWVFFTKLKIDECLMARVAACQ